MPETRTVKGFSEVLLPFAEGDFECCTFDHSDNSPCLFSSGFLSRNLLKNSLGRKQERKQKIFDFEIFRVEMHQRKSGGRKSQVLPKFRVSSVMTTLIPLRILCREACSLCVLFNHTRKCRKNQEDSFRKIKKLRRGGLVRGSGTKVTVIGALNKSVSVYCGNLVTLPKMQKSPRSAEQKRHCAVLTNNQDMRRFPEETRNRGERKPSSPATADWCKCPSEL